MRLLVTGGGGQLGRAVTALARARGEEVLSLGRETDVIDRAALTRAVEGFSPEAVIHCAAYTDVDGAETERERAYAVNALGAENIALACAHCGSKLLYLSTDFVFDGEGETPFGPHDPVSPANYYGYTKAEGERAAAALLKELFIVRTSWLYGGKNSFVRKLLSRAAKERELSVVCDQYSVPTFRGDLARLLLALAGTERYGVYHGVNEGSCSRYEFAREILRAVRWDGKLLPVTSDEFPARARRPKNSRLGTEELKAAGYRLPDWREALLRYLHCEEKDADQSDEIAH